jgi:transcription elongation factor GreA
MLTMSMERVPMTTEGFQKLEAELHRLKAEERPRIIQAIAEARAHGDLSENAEYHAAKEAQGLNEAKVAELEDKLSRAEVIEPAKVGGETVKFGATVTLEDEDSGDKVKYKIVGEHEASVRDGKISIASPIARALIGKSRGDTAEVVTPKGARSYEILKIEWK